MLLATPGQAANFKICHAPASASASGSSNSNGINSNHIQSKALSSAHKLGRTTYKLIESSQKSTATAASSSSSTAKKAQAAVSMKTIAARPNRSSGFHSATHSAPANSISKSNVTFNDDVVNGVKKTIASTAATVNNGNTSKSTTKATSTALSSSSAANSTSCAAAPAAAIASTSSSSSLTKIVVTGEYLKKYAVPPTELHRHSEARLRSYSIDSLYDEMCHFKPIRSVPETPWKRGSKSRGITIKVPKAILGRRSSNCDVDMTIKRIRKESKRESSKAKSKIKPKLSANLFPVRKPHPSAFVRLLLPMGSYTIPSSIHRIGKRYQSLKTPESDLETIWQTPKTATKKPTQKGAKKPSKKVQKLKKHIEVAAAKPKGSNTKKRKAQTQPKKRQTAASKKSKIDTVNRKTPPLTRRRIRMDENCKLYGPLA